MSAGALALVFLAASPGTAAAEESDTHTCSGTLTSPGVLAGSYESVRVTGVCFVNAGAARIRGDLTLAPGSGLAAAFGRNDATGTGTSSLWVGGDVRVGRGAALLLGCEPGHFTCFDDTAKPPTLSSRSHVEGDLEANNALGVVVHNSVIGGDVQQTGGGGGLNCNPAGVFAPGPAYSDYEDTLIHGDVTISKLNACYLGIARDHVKGDVRLINNHMADPDAIEILANHISDDLVCRGNSAVWDSAELSFMQMDLYPRGAQPNVVRGDREGQCRLASPATLGGLSGPGPF
ncbi:MAG: hypothetical protein ABI323_10845 [Solirubrobacteraceae bacterium]